MSVSFKTKDGSTVDIDESEITELKGTLAGGFYLPSDKEEYAESCHIWNKMFMPDSGSKYSRKPAAAAKPAGASDCSKIIKFAAKHSLLISIRGGGHNVAGSALCDGGLVINLRGMNQTIVDPVAQTAITQGGTNWREFYEECYACRLGTTGGIVGDTGVAGLTVGGGIGYLRTKHGMAIDNILAMQVVTADGDIKTCDKKNNSDLFYALRGGGGGYALVTSFTFKLYPIPDQHWTVIMAWDLELMPKVITAVQAFIDSGEDEEMALQSVGWPECGLPIPDLQGKDKMFVAGGYAGAEGKDAQDVHARVKKFLSDRIGAEPIDLSHPAPYTEWNAAFDPIFPMGTDNAYWKGFYCPKLTEELGKDILEVMATRPPEANKTFVAFWTTYGKMLRPDDTDVAFAKRHPGAIVSFDSTWTADSGPDGDEKCIAYTRAGAKAIEKYSDGAYLQWVGSEEERKEASTKQYDDIDKLVAIKKKYDPEFLFPSWIKM